MSAFKQGQKVIHDWYSSRGSRLFTFVRLTDPFTAIVLDEAGHQHTLITGYLKLAEPAVREERWLVWSPTGTTNPTVTHVTENEARKVARQMAERHGGTFYAVKVGHGYHQGPAVKPPIQEV